MGQMTLTDAVKLGTANRKQARHVVFDVDRNTTCFLGAALEGLGVDVTQNLKAPMLDLETKYPWLNKTPEPCPACGVQLRSLLTLGMHLNDSHERDRVIIALYLEARKGAPEPWEKLPVLQNQSF